MADNLKPPGIDVPAKLAAIHMELGNLADALTLLTDLKNRGSGRAAKSVEGGNVPADRSEFESSYRAWWLYADLMLRIGHECTQWNRGVRTNDNYMFRRWLRKLSKEFDWQERRLQALSLALEAAVGSRSAERYLTWVRQRAHRKASSIDKERWHGDTDNSTKVNQAAKNNEKPDDNVVNDQESNDKVVQDKGNIVKANMSTEEAVESPSEQHGVAAEPPENGQNETELTGSQIEDPLVSTEDTSQKEIGPHANDEAEHSQFDKEMVLLTEKNAEELKAFDRTTKELGLEPGSVVAKNREETRKKILFRHKDEIRTLANEYGQALSTSEAARPNDDADNEDEVIGLGNAQLQISASCHTVCRIASELMKHMYGLALFEGGALVGEVVSKYFKERAKVEDKKIAARKRSVEWQRNAEESLLFYLGTEKVSKYVPVWRVIRVD